MNAQLEELDKRARIWAMDNTTFPISSHIPPGYTEHFAKLIVRKCALLCDSNDDMDRILEHFGIAE